jgi:hypothetical protein
MTRALCSSFPCARKTAAVRSPRGVCFYSHPCPTADTMAYTSSALAFMLQNLSKTVVITGAQIPLSRPRSDGVDNFLGALSIAGHFDIPEVW